MWGCALAASPLRQAVDGRRRGRHDVPCCWTCAQVWALRQGRSGVCAEAAPDILTQNLRRELWDAPPVAVVREVELARDTHKAEHDLQYWFQGDGAAAEAEVGVRSVRLPALRSMNVDGADVDEPPDRPEDEKGARQHVPAKAAVFMASVRHVRHVMASTVAAAVVHGHSAPERLHNSYGQKHVVSYKQALNGCSRLCGEHRRLSRQQVGLASACRGEGTARTCKQQATACDTARCPAPTRVRGAALRMKTL